MGDTNHAVGAIIRRGKKYLLIDRKNFPFGFACIAGHVKEHETPEQALKAEVTEESSLKVIKFKQVLEEFLPWCGCRFHKSHMYTVYEVEATGRPKLCEAEAKSIGWYTIEEIKKLKLEKALEYFFKKLGIL